MDLFVTCAVSYAAITSLAFSRSSSVGPKCLFAVSIVFGCISVLPSNPKARPCPATTTVIMHCDMCWSQLPVRTMFQTSCHHWGPSELHPEHEYYWLLQPEHTYPNWSTWVRDWQCVLHVNPITSKSNEQLQRIQHEHFTVVKSLVPITRQFSRWCEPAISLELSTPDGVSIIAHISNSEGAPALSRSYTM